MRLPSQLFSPGHYVGWTDLRMLYLIKGIGPVPHVVNDNAFTWTQTRCYRAMVEGFYRAQASTLCQLNENP